MLRFLVLALLALLAACGGGGGGGGDAPPSPTTSLGAVATPYASIAGKYQSWSEILTASTFDLVSGTLRLNADGTIAGGMSRSFQDAPVPITYGNDTIRFFGALVSTGPDGVAAGEITFVYKALRAHTAANGIDRVEETTTQSGTGTIEVSGTLVDGAPAISVHFPSVNVPFKARTMVLAKGALPAAYQGMAPERLSGWYQFRVDLSIPGTLDVMNTVVHIDAVTGAISGSFGPDCSISGRFFGYHSASGMFRQEWTFVGTGCPVQGTGQFLGQLGSGATVTLEAVGFFEGRWALVAAHSQVPTLPGPYALIAGWYRFSQPDPNENADIHIHPDGTVVAFLSKSAEDIRDSRRLAFSGRLSGSGPTYTVTGEVASATQAGTATLELTPTTSGASRAFSVRIASATVPVPIPSFTAAGGGTAGSGFFGVPIEKIGGLYSWGEAFTPPPGEPSYPPLGGAPSSITVDAVTGAMSGSFGPDCQLTGRLFAYEPSYASFRMDLTLQGAGCPLNGTGQLLGGVGTSPSGRISIGARGVFAQRPLTIGLTHSQQLAP
jgi:hypothetical protein